MSLLPTPKQPQPERLKDWYPYYAGFTAQFADAALTEFFPHATTLLDPWNGSGTTTAVAAVRGIACIGIDINPAMTVIARARLTPTTIRESLGPIGRDITAAAQLQAPPTSARDPLTHWLRTPAIGAIRRIQLGIHRVVIGDDLRELDVSAIPSAVEKMPLLAAFYYAALFAVARDLLRPFRASNPTWLRDPPSHRHRLSPSAELISETFSKRIQFLADRLTVPHPMVPDGAVLTTASAVDFCLPSQVDGCLTSPPYATRVDYVRDGLAELAVLGLDAQQTEALRTVATGTPVVKGRPHDMRPLSSAEASAIVARVAAHGSHGSANYYGPWLNNYFTDLDSSIGRICKGVKADGRIGILVQDSHYKTLTIDMQRVVAEMLAARGRAIISREDFPVRHSIARMNPSARVHLRDRTNTESLLVFS